MALAKPEAAETLEQMLYRLAADTGIELRPDRLRPVLVDARATTTGDRIRGVELELSLDVSSPAAIHDTAGHLRELAELLEAGADKWPARSG